MKKNLLVLLPCLALLLVGCDGNTTTSTDSTSSDHEKTSVEKAVAALQNLEEVALSGKFVYSETGEETDEETGETVTTTNEYEYNTVGYWSSNITQITSTDVDYPTYSYSETYVRGPDGELAGEFLDRDNEVKLSYYYYTSTGETAYYDDNFTQPFAGIVNVDDCAEYDEETNTLKVWPTLTNDALYTLQQITAIDSEGYYYAFGSTVEITFSDAFVPTGLSFANSVSGSGNKADISYTATFVDPSTVTINHPVPYEAVEGQDKVGELLTALNEATSYTATFDGDLYSLVLTLVEGKGVVLANPDGSEPEGTMATSDTEYVEFFNVDDNNVPNASSYVQTGDPVAAFYGDDYPVPDFAFAQELFSVNDDGTFTLLDCYNKVNYLLPDNTLGISNYITSLTISGSVEAGITISYSVLGYYTQTIVITGLNTTEFPYTEYNEYNPPETWSEALGADYSSANEFLNPNGTNYTLDENIPYYLPFMKEWQEFEYVTSVNLCIPVDGLDESIEYLNEYAAILDANAEWTAVTNEYETAVNAVAYENEATNLRIVVRAGESYFDLFVSNTEYGWANILGGYESQEQSYGIQFTAKLIAEIVPYLPPISPEGNMGVGLFYGSDGESIIWATYDGSYISIDETFVLALNQTYTAYDEILEADGWTDMSVPAENQYAWTKVVDGVTYQVSLAYTQTDYGDYTILTLFEIIQSA